MTERSEPVEPLAADMFDPACPVSSPASMGDKWTAMIVLCLEQGPRRFGELRVPLRRITPKVLTASLRALERDGLVARTAYDGAAPRVEYELTPLGRSYLELLAASRNWCATHGPSIRAARAAHEAAS